MCLEVWGDSVINRVDAIYQVLLHAGVLPESAVDAAWVIAHNQIGWSE